MGCGFESHGAYADQSMFFTHTYRPIAAYSFAYPRAPYTTRHRETQAGTTAREPYEALPCLRRAGDTQGGAVTLDFTAIDFETANPYRRSVCAVAMVKVRDGRIVDRMHRLVSPPTGLDDFRNTWVHGIGPEHVRDAATWDVVLHEVADFIGPDPLVAHNAAFDSSVLVRSSEAVGYAVSGLRFVCTYRAARGLLALGSYSLPFVAAVLGFHRSITTTPTPTRKRQHTSHLRSRGSSVEQLSTPSLATV